MVSESSRIEPHDVAGKFESPKFPVRRKAPSGAFAQMAFLILFISICFFAALPAWAGINQWTATNGPLGGGIGVISVSPNYAADSTVFAGGVRAKVYKSTDGGANWVASLFNTPVYDSITCVAISPNFTSDRTVFAGINSSGGIYKTVNGGTTWVAVNNGIGSFTDIRALAISPNFASDQTIFAGTYTGVYKSTNGGANWSLVATGMSGGKYIFALAISPNFINDSTVYAGASTGELYKTINGGTNWSTVVSAGTYTTEMSLAISPSFASDQTLFVGRNDGLFKLGYGGAWGQIDSSSKGTSVRGLAISPNGTIFVSYATGGVYRVSNGGTTWTAIGSGLPAMPVLSFATSANYAGDQTVLAGTSAGVFKSVNAGASWVEINSGIANSNIYALAAPASYAVDHTLFAGSYLGLLQTSTDGANWTAGDAGISFVNGSRQIYSIVASPGYDSDRTAFASVWGGGVYKTTDGGAGWSSANGGILNLEVDLLAISPDYESDKTVFAGCSWGKRVYKTTDGGSSWTPAFTTPNLVYALAISTNYASDQTAFAGIYKGGVYKTTNGGATWTPLGLTGFTVMSFAVSPNYAGDQTVYAGTGDDGIWASTDGGSSWEKRWCEMPAGFEASINSIALSPDYADDGIVIAGTGGGHWGGRSTSTNAILISTNGGLNWSKMNSGLPAALISVKPAVFISPDFATDRTVFAGTLGYGVYSYTFPNRAPVAVSDSFSIDEDGVLVVPPTGVLGNDSDADGDPLTAILVSGPSRGTVTLNGNGSFTYTPDADFNGVDSFNYQAGDGHVYSNVATVVITVTPVNDPPVATADAYGWVEDGSYFSPSAPGVLINDTDVDGDSLSALLVTGPRYGTVTLNADGSFQYLAPPDFNGDDYFTYCASDGQATSAPVTVSIHVNAVNDKPVAAGQSVATAEDTPLAVTLTATDVDGDALTYALASAPAHGTLSGTAPNLTYTPNANFNGSDSFTFTARDWLVASDPATVTITVTPVNDPPVATADAYGWVEDGSYFSPSAPGVLINDTDVDGDPLSALLVTGPQYGTVTLNANGSFQYLAPPNFNGDDYFTYSASDGQATSAPVTVSIHVNAVNDKPVAAGQSVATAEDTPLAVTLTATDVDGDALTYALASAPAHGTLSGTAPNLTYTPNADFNGSDSFTFTARDWLVASDPATVTITVTPVNDPPVANNDTTATAAYVPTVIAVLANDTDVDGDALTVSSATQGANGTTAVLADGSIRYTPAAGFTGTDSFSYVVADGNGGTGTGTVAVSIRAQLFRITALTMATVTSGSYTNATATPLAVDEAGAPLAGLSIGGRWSGLTSDSDTGTTGADGKVTMSSNKVRNAKGIFTFTINTAAKAGFELDGPASVLANAIQYPAPPPPAGKLHVASIVMGLKTGKSTNATAAVTVVDAGGAPVASAAVSVSWSGAVGGTSSGTTGADGKVTLSSAAIKNPAGKTFTCTVNGITKIGWTYDPAANVVTSNSVTVQ